MKPWKQPFDVVAAQQRGFYQQVIHIYRGQAYEQHVGDLWNSCALSNYMPDSVLEATVSQ